MSRSCEILNRSVVYLRLRWEKLTLWSTGLRDPLPSTLVECMLKVLQSSVFSQISQAHLFQGPSRGGFSNDGHVECIHVAATKFLPLLRREGFGMVLLVDARQIAATILAVSTAETRRTTWSLQPQGRCYRTQMRSRRS